MLKSKEIPASAGATDPSHGDDTTPPVRVVLFPELSIPRRYVDTIKRFAQREQAIIIAGIEFDSEPARVRNETIIAIPTPDRHPESVARSFWVAKHHPAPYEWESLVAHKIDFVAAPDLVCLDHAQIGPFGVSICYDLYAVNTLVGFQGHILHLFVPAFNRDLSTFESLSESAMRLLFCNVVVANSGCYGGSLAVSPYYLPRNREVLRMRGEHIDAVERFWVPVEPLRLEQQHRTSPKQQEKDKQNPKRFKEKPADWPKRGGGI
jgi:predicted amidohydrolase